MGKAKSQKKIVWMLWKKMATLAANQYLLFRI